MIDITKQYTYQGKPVRIYADGSDTTYKKLHCGVKNHINEWDIATCWESDLVEVWQPKEGEWCFFWDSLIHGCHVRKFVEQTTEGYVDSCNTYWVYCAPFTGKLPEAFKGL